MQSNDMRDLSGRVAVVTGGHRASGEPSERSSRATAPRTRHKASRRRETFRIMKERRSGCIISIAAAAFKIGGLATGVHYAASKAGAICFTKSLALQVAPYHINVNAVYPGPTATEMTDAWGEETNRAFKVTIPWKDYGKSKDVAEAVAFLAADRALHCGGNPG